MPPTDYETSIAEITDVYAAAGRDTDNFQPAMYDDTAVDKMGTWPSSRPGRYNIETILIRTR